MKKEEVRKEFFKLRIKGNSYAVCIRVLKATLGYEVTKRTLQRWTNRLNDTNWNLKDNSTKPKTVYTKIDSVAERTPELPLADGYFRPESRWKILLCCY